MQVKNEAVELSYDDKVLDNIMSVLGSKAFVKIGVLGNPPHDADSGVGMAELAAIHEFGAPAANIPERSFLRSSIGAHGKEFSGFLASNKTKIMEALYKNQWERVLKQFGAKWVGYVLTAFDSRGFGQWPALADITIARRIKHSDVPLQDTGALRQSIVSEVSNGD